MNIDRAALLVAVALSAGVACHRPPQGPVAPPDASLRCDRGYAVSVANNTAKDVDVWQAAASGWDYVGSVPSRTTRELPLATGSPVQWRWPPTAESPRYDPKLSIDVTLHVHCT